tara:strand:+ start:514 stop:684 length:171 start_codon:yes stop_codon:yes gene_type:complete
MKQKRQQGALARLRTQLESGVKTEVGTRDKRVPLTAKDIKRISKEITTLESKKITL